MAGALASAKSKSRGSRRRSRAVMSDINITPFVDVMLVLLIVFMVAAPLLVIGVPIDLPRTQANPLPPIEKPISITVTKDGSIFVQDIRVGEDELIDKLSAISNNKDNQRIYIRGDTGVDYGNVLSVVGVVSNSGYRRIGLVSDRELTEK